MSRNYTAQNVFEAALDRIGWVYREMEFCPVCLLRKGLAGGVESSFENAVKPTPDQPGWRFDHYELVTGEDGKPVELGRGAMGVTYKAFDINLRCPVTLKLISERYLGDESARLRFFREARAAARLRHSNVASVLHLGTAGRKIQSSALATPPGKRHDF
jgi:hypothetical protein